MSKGVGLYIGTNEVIAVSAVSSPSGPRIKKFSVEPVADLESDLPNPNISTLAKTIARALAKIEEKGAYATITLSPTFVATRQFTIPDVPKTEMAFVIPNEASRYLPFKLEEAVLDYSVIKSFKQVVQVTATAIPKSILENYLAEIKTVSVKPLIVEPAFSAISRAFFALRMIDKEPARGLVFIQADNNVNITLSVGGVVYLSRDFSVSESGADAAKRFFEELSTSLNYFYKVTGGEAVKQILLSGSGDLKTLGESLEKDFDYQIRFDVARFAEQDKISASDSAKILIAFGLACRDLGISSPLGDVKLLPLEKRSVAPAKIMQFVAIGAIVILGLLGLSRFIFIEPDLKQLRGQIQEINQEGTFLDLDFTSRTQDDLANEKENLKNKLKQQKLIQDRRVSTVRILEDMAKGLPKAISMDNVTMLISKTAEQNAASGEKPNQLSIRGICQIISSEKEAAILTGWIKSLQIKENFKKCFPEIRMTEMQRTKLHGKNASQFLIVSDSGAKE